MSPKLIQLGEESAPVCVDGVCALPAPAPEPAVTGETED